MIDPRNNKKQNNPGLLVCLLAIIAASFGSTIVKTLNGLFKGSHSSDAIIGFSVVLGIIVVLVAVAATKEKRGKAAGNVQMQKAKEILIQNMRKAAAGEEAVSCQHETGKNRYIAQLDEFLKNGLIEKEEYNIMRRKYENLDIADDYH